MVNYIKINHEKYGYDILALFQSFYPESSWQLVFPGCREQISEEAEKIGFFAELNFGEGENAPAEVKLKRYVGTSAEAEVCTYENITGAGERDAGSDEKGYIGSGREYDILRYPGGLGADLKEGFGNWLYDELVKKTGRTLPWGTLNGVRPTKLAYSRLEEGRSDEDIVDYYINERKTSRYKAELALDIAKRERELLKNLHLTDGYSLYIGIPFCPSTCLYCSFTSYPIGAYRKEVDRYLDALISELEFVAEKMRGKILDTIYIGGGTPTTLSPEQLDRLLGRVAQLFDTALLREYTVEAGRADSITEEKLRVIKSYGITRISINPQTFNQETLDFIGRKASVARLLEVWPVARSLGFDNINMDIILGLPGEGAAEVENTIRMVKQLKPDSLTVHSLAIKRASKLAQWIIDNGKETIRNSDAVMDIAAKGAEELGLVPYYLYRQKNMSGNLENVGFAAPGKEGIYNILIMEELQSILAVGAGTVTKRVYYENGKVSKLTRCENVKEVGMYCDRIKEMMERKLAI
ncbi:MAG: coproporphyrinogen dehydrogenase HemZ [Lachnospiraceae bacterium]|nr:coproporphyrinogen dehydrogenase HemZ [Lachnospiraceae bacterium]